MQTMKDIIIEKYIYIIYLIMVIDINRTKNIIKLAYENIY